MNPHRLRPKYRASALYGWLAVKRAGGSHDVRRLVLRNVLEHLQRLWRAEAAWQRFEWAWMRPIASYRWGDAPSELTIALDKTWCARCDLGAWTGVAHDMHGTYIRHRPTGCVFDLTWRVKFD